MSGAAKPRRLICASCGEPLDTPDGVLCAGCKREVDLLRERRHVESKLAEIGRRVARFEKWRSDIDAELGRLERARNGETELPLDHGAAR